MARSTSDGAPIVLSGDVERNPGPPMAVISANVTSLARQYEAILDLQADVLGLQEIRLGEVAQKSYASRLRAHGWQSFWGKPQPIITGDNVAPSAWNAAAGGVGILVKEGIPAKAAAIVGTAMQELWDSRRWCHTMVAYGSGRTVLHVMSVYGYVGEELKTEELLTKVFEVAAGLGKVPILIVGDLNITSTLSHAIQAAVETKKWSDVAEVWATAKQEEPQPTCLVARPNCPGTRIDYVLANEVALQGLRNFSLVLDSGICTHRPLRVELDLEVYAQITPTMV